MRIAVRPSVTLAALVSATLAVAAAYEAPRTFQASEVLKPSQVKGPHFSVAPAVKTEGYFFLFDITTDYGALEAEGKSMLFVRLSEVHALAQLDEVSKSEVFLKAAGTSVLNVGKGVASVVKDPKATAAGMGEGVKRFGTNLGRKAKRAGDKAVEEVSGDDKGEGDQVLRGQGGGRRDRDGVLGARGEQGLAEVGAEDRGRPVHDEPDPQEGAHRHRPDRRRRRASRPRSWSRSRWWSRAPRRSATSCGPRTPRSCGR